MELDLLDVSRMCLVDQTKANVIPRWQSALLLIGICLLGGPDGFEIVNLGAAILLAVALVPYGIQLIMNKTPMSGASQGETGRDQTVLTGPVVDPNGAHQNEDSTHGYRSQADLEAQRS